MYLERNIDKDLEIWKDSDQRKPLLLRGARQVGKSSSVRNLAQKFEYFVEINFDENPKRKELKFYDESNHDILFRYATMSLKLLFTG